MADSRLFTAHHLRRGGRRRVDGGPDWVKAPNVFSGPLGPPPLEEDTMTWTKPEAEVVAVTMEVTAYVATL